MTKEEACLSVVMGAISMALKDPILQQGFEIICKNLTEHEKEIAELKELLKRYVPYRQITDSKAYKDLAEETEQFLSEDK